MSPVVGKGQKAKRPTAKVIRPTPTAAVAAAPVAGPVSTDRLNRELVTLHGRRSADEGVDASGLFAHYQRLVELEVLIGARERAVLDLIENDLPAYGTYVVLRAGVGELALLIAASGRKVVASEPNHRRRRAIEAGRAHLEGLGLIPAGAVTIVEAVIPQELVQGAALGVGLNVAYGFDDDAASTLIDSLSAVENLLIDPRLFLRVRDPADQERLALDLERNGFDRRHDYPGKALALFSRSANSAEVSARTA